MKIAIFGDSYGHCTGEKWETYAPHINLGWPEILAKHHTVQNFCESGAGLWYSFNQFLEHNKKFDLNIFLPSQNTRFSIYLPEMKKTLHMVPGYQDGQDIRNLKVQWAPVDNSILDAAAGYVDHILDYKKEDYTGKLLVKEIHKIRPDTLIIDCFYELALNEPVDGEVITLSYFSESEIRHWRMNSSIFKRQKKDNLEDFRKCHLSDENNVMLAKKILKCIENNENLVKFHLSDFQLPSKSKTHYLFARKKIRK